jgi:hypothetical protein
MNSRKPYGKLLSKGRHSSKIRLYELAIFYDFVLV